jgi:hypothetical protein
MHFTLKYLLSIPIVLLIGTYPLNVITVSGAAFITNCFVIVCKIYN